MTMHFHKLPAHC